MPKSPAFLVKIDVAELQEFAVVISATLSAYALTVPCQLRNIRHIRHSVVPVAFLGSIKRNAVGDTGNVRNINGLKLHGCCCCGVRCGRIGRREVAALGVEEVGLHVALRCSVAHADGF
jgi:hypothetical protein